MAWQKTSGLFDPPVDLFYATMLVSYYGGKAVCLDDNERLVQ